MKLILAIALITTSAIPWQQPIIQQHTSKEHLTFLNNEFKKASMRHNSSIYNNDTDLDWQNIPSSWHQQTARTIDHRFTTFKTLLSFARKAKRAGVSVLMLVQIQKTKECPGSWYNGLQLCEHINGTNPSADGTLIQWKSLIQEIKPMRLMWWTNPTYFSVQGPVWKQAIADKQGTVGNFFSWNVTNNDTCWGPNPCDPKDGICAQGGWPSITAFSGTSSALASFGSSEFADYSVDAMVNSWMKNIGIDGFTIDTSANYNDQNHNPFPKHQTKKECPGGMLQCQGDAQAAWSAIVARVRQQQPHVVLSGELFSSWQEVIHTNSNIGGQGYPGYHTAMRNGILNGDVSNVESVANSSGSDAASVLCYLHPHYDGVQPGGCPSMYFRDVDSVLADLQQHEMLIALEAASGILSQHDYDPDSYCTHGFNGCSKYGQGAWWNVTADPYDADETKESLLGLFGTERVLNRLALRTKLEIVSSNGNGNGGALAYLKHDSAGPIGEAAILIFNPGPAQNITINLKSLPVSLLDNNIKLHNLITNETSQTALSEQWTVEMKQMEMKFMAGFSLGVFAPRQGKKKNCVSKDGYIKHSKKSTLQGCFLACKKLKQCQNIFVDYIDILWMETPAAINCTLLGEIVDPSKSCEKGTGTLIKRMDDGRPGR